MVRAVIDTNVLVEGLSRRGESGRVIEHWAASRFTPCVSTALALEYEEILCRKWPASRHGDVRAALQALLDRAEYIPIAFALRPASPDADDDFLLECAFNAHSSLVSRNLRDLVAACAALKIELLEPAAFLATLDSVET
jgi:predicted nucleic acid-binding protein